MTRVVPVEALPAQLAETTRRYPRTLLDAFPAAESPGPSPEPRDPVWPYVLGAALLLSLVYSPQIWRLFHPGV